MNTKTKDHEEERNFMIKRLAWCVGAVLLGACVALGADETPGGVMMKVSGTATTMTATGAQTPTSEKTPDGCTIEKFTVHSAKMNREIKVAVVLPPAYGENADARFPVLYTLHGSGAPYASYAEMIPLRKTLREHPMIVVCFDGDKMGWFIDAPKNPQSQFTTFFFDELIPYMDGHFRTRASAGYRGVTGFSMGGHGAFHYMLERPGVLGSVSTMSAVFSFDGNANARRLRIITPLLGPYEENKADYAKFRIYPRLDAYLQKGLPVPPIFIHCGTEDHLVDESRGMVSYLIQANKERKQAGKPPIIFQYKESPGGHAWPFWRDGSVGIADFHWRCFEQATAAAAKAAASRPATRSAP